MSKKSVWTPELVGVPSRREKSYLCCRHSAVLMLLQLHSQWNWLGYMALSARTTSWLSCCGGTKTCRSNGFSHLTGKSFIGWPLGPERKKRREGGGGAENCINESFMFCASTRIEGGQIKDNKMARAHGTVFQWGRLKETDHLDDLDMEGEDTIKMDLTGYWLD